MARLINCYNEGSEFGSEDAEELSYFLSQNDNTDELPKGEKRWPIVYGFSHLRQNLLNWYPFSPGADILEVGAGCGALTGFFCEKGAYVAAVEQSPACTEIIFKRNKKRDNLDVYAGDIFTVDFDRKFDYIVVIGSLAYASLVSKAKDPYSDFLTRLKYLLKPDGHILLAISNRFGLRYFAGAREDHTSRFFDGINGYSADSNVRTFTKHELEQLLDKNGLCSRRFYYPLPDYKFPSCIYTDESIGNFDSWMDLGTLDYQRYELFNEIDVMHSLAAEGVLDKFANSFLVDATLGGIRPDDSVILAKLSAARKPQYRIATIIRKTGGKKMADKIPLNEACKPHLQRMADNFKKYGSLHGVPLVPCRIEKDGAAVFDFASGKKYSDLIASALENGVDALWPLLDGYRERIFKDAEQRDYYTEEFAETFGTERCERELLSVCPANIDFIFDNIVVGENGELTAVDYEWVADFAVPADYIFWRSIFISDVFKLKDDLKDAIFTHYGITDEMRKTFYSWEIAFSTNKIGSITLEGKSNIKLDINDVDPATQQCRISAGVTFDTGNGFDMKKTARQNLGFLDEPNVMKILVGPGVRSARFDPAEGIACQCQIVSVKCAGNVLHATPLNAAASRDGVDFFLTLDPVYIIDGEFAEGSMLEIRYIVSRLDPSAADIAINALRQKISALEAEKRELESKLERLQISYDTVVNSKSWKLTAPLRKCKSAISAAHKS